MVYRTYGIYSQWYTESMVYTTTGKQMMWYIQQMVHRTMIWTTNGIHMWYILFPPQASKIPKENPRTKEMTGQGKPKIRTEQTQCSF